jgi:uncharacterized membrane protein (DUF485 family)
MPGNSTPPAGGRSARFGLLFFFIYLIAYAGFMWLVAFSPELRQKTVWGVNVPILYGLGLIVFALVLALLYMLVCKPGRETDDAEDRR